MIEHNLAQYGINIYTYIQILGSSHMHAFRVSCQCAAQLLSKLSKATFNELIKLDIKHETSTIHKPATSFDILISLDPLNPSGIFIERFLIPPNETFETCHVDGDIIETPQIQCLDC